MEEEKTYRALLIDPQTKTVSEVQIKNNLSDWYRTLGCSMVEFCKLNLVSGTTKINSQFMFDEEGLLKDNISKFTFQHQPVEYQWFAGKALMVNIDIYADKMKDVSKKIQPKHLLDIITWED